MRICMTALALLISATVVACDDSKPVKKVDKPAVKADDEKDKEKDVKPKLGIGDPAPKISDVKWLKGDPVTSFEPKKVYVLEFWATWCGPCIAAMPHLSELQAQYKSQGLVVVGVTTDEPKNNSAEKVKEFLAKKGGRARYTMALCETDETDAAYMKAAKQDGIPCSFVIDGMGKIAYIGHPMNLDDVLPKVINGTWKGQADADAIEKLMEEFFAILGKASEDPDVALKELAEFDKAHPSKKDWMPDQRFMVLVTAKKWEQAKPMADKMMAKAIASQDSGPLGMIAYALANEKMNPDKKHIGMAVTAAEAALKLDGETDTRCLLSLADAHFANGSKDKAIEFGEKALKSTEIKGFKDFIEKKLKTYKGETDEKKEAKPKDDK